MGNRFYITAAIPYVNATPHIGHAQEFVEVDVISRYHRLLGNDVLSLSGADENALKNVKAAEREGMPIQEFVDKNNKRYVELTKELNVQFDIWQRGSDEKHHYPASQKLWELCEANGDIYKKSYEGLYCVGCEAFYSPEELSSNGECSEHPGKKLDKVEEENYFFRLSKYQNKLTSLIETEELKIVPEIRRNEVLSFLRSGLHDLSISRSNERAQNWGVPVPNDPSQRIYVWFDALNIYQSGVGFGWNKKKYKKWWPADVHVIGKGIIRFHAVYWPAFLLSANLKLPKKLFVHGYITVEGQKMSKTVGNVVDPFDLIKKYGTDAVRYYLLREIPAYGDGDFSERRFKELYNADLANGLGNLVARVAKLCQTNEVVLKALKKEKIYDSLKIGGYTNYLENFQFDLALERIWWDIKRLDRIIDKDEPWAKSKEKAIPLLKKYAKDIRKIALALTPFLPDTSKKIEKQFSGRIRVIKPLFPRL